MSELVQVSQAKKIFCDQCGEQVRNTYHALYMHCKRQHGGRKGATRGRLKSKAGLSHKKTLNPDRIITLTIIMPTDGMRYIFRKSMAEWLRLVKISSEFNTKDRDEFALMAAAATFAMKYKRTVEQLKQSEES